MAIYSCPDICAWRETLCATLGITPLFPVFGSDTAHLARTMIAGGLRAQLCCVDTTQLAARQVACVRYRIPARPTPAH